MFKSTDRAFWIGEQEGVVQPGQDIGPISHASGSFKLELKRNGVFGPFVAAAGPVFGNGQDGCCATMDGWSRSTNRRRGHAANPDPARSRL